MAGKPPVWVAPYPHRIDWDFNRMVKGVPYMVTVPRHGRFRVRKLGELVEVQRVE